MQGEVTTFRYAAAQYLWFWVKFDRCVVDDFERNGVTCETLDKLFREYKVSRTIPGRGRERLQPFVDMLNRQRNVPITNKNVAEVVHVASRRMVDHYRRTCLSAVSKAYWMMCRHPVAIYDSLARAGLAKDGLRAGEGDYTSYHRSWVDFFGRPETQRAVENACGWLPTSHYAQSLVDRKAATQQEINTWVRADWFHNRIVDQRLVIRGNPAGEDLVHPADEARLLGPGEQR